MKPAHPHTHHEEKPGALKPVTGKNGKLFTADTGEAYEVRTAVNFTPGLNYTPAAFFPTVYVNVALPGGVDPKTCISITTNTSIVPLFSLYTAVNSFSDTVVYLISGSMYSTYHGTTASVGNFNPQGISAMTKLYPYVSLSNSGYSNNVAMLWAQIPWNKNDFIDFKGSGVVVYSPDIAQSFTGLFLPNSEITPAGAVTQICNSFLYLELV